MKEFSNLIDLLFKLKYLNWMNDKKYESLRKKLDKLGFTQTLNPDSV